ncbi:MAG: PepSY-associated TM helix domain-containing protein [Polyangiales bacterium]
MQRSRKFRNAALWAHRYVGLVMSAFLLIAGLTGSMMAFYVPLDRVLNPELFIPKAHAGAKLLDPFVLREKLNEQLPPEQQVHGTILKLEPDENVNYWVDGRETFVDPYTGEVAGSRRFGDPREGRKSILTFLYVLHFSLALGEVGHILFGVVAILWTLDCFVGAYLTFPPPLQRKGPSSKGWFARWLPMWQLKTSKLFTLIFTWHRASGLWVWMVLLMFAWSAVALNMGTVYDSVTGVFLGKRVDQELPELDKPLEQPPITQREAIVLGRKLMAHEASTRGFSIIAENGLEWLPEHGAFSYVVESTLDIDERFAGTALSYTPEGKLLQFSAPKIETRRNTFDSWLIALHFGAIREGGTLYRAFVCLMGLAVALLSASGFWIWWKKRHNRNASAA